MGGSYRWPGSNQAQTLLIFQNISEKILRKQRIIFVRNDASFRKGVLRFEPPKESLGRKVWVEKERLLGNLEGLLRCRLKQSQELGMLEEQNGFAIPDLSGCHPRKGIFKVELKDFNELLLLL